MIQYISREKTRSEKTRSEETLERLLGLATDIWPMDPAKRIERDAASIATAMATIHGGEWRVQIDHLAGLVMVVRH